MPCLAAHFSTLAQSANRPTSSAACVPRRSMPLTREALRRLAVPGQETLPAQHPARHLPENLYDTRQRLIGLAESTDKAALCPFHSLSVSRTQGPACLCSILKMPHHRPLELNSTPVRLSNDFCIRSSNLQGPGLCHPQALHPMNRPHPILSPPGVDKPPGTLSATGWRGEVRCHLSSCWTALRLSVTRHRNNRRQLRSLTVLPQSCEFPSSRRRPTLDHW